MLKTKTNTLQETIVRGPRHPEVCKFIGYQSIDPNALCYCKLLLGMTIGYCYDVFENCCIKERQAPSGYYLNLI